MPATPSRNNCAQADREPSIPDMDTRLADPSPAGVPDLDALRVAVIGAGYVGLPLAAELGRHGPVTAFDVDADRIARLAAGHDDTREVGDDELAAAEHLTFSSRADAIGDANFYIVTVPTPIDAHNRPDLTALTEASRTVGAALTPGNVVVYESTVYPGTTEEVCVPVLEEASGLAFNRDFFVGYSPERVNPGDKRHRLADIVKVTAGSTPDTARLVDAVYSRIVPAGTHPAPSIRVAEAAKVIENIQRDVNIALINELTILFQRLGLDTQDVLAAARTKWNFLPFGPGFVGGHCIGVDPYYLTHKAQEVGHHPEMILAGRRINNEMGRYAAGLVLDELMRRGVAMTDARALIMGFTFKENTPDIRNTKVIDIVRALEARGIAVDVHDPLADPAECRAEYGIDLCACPEQGAYDAVILAVAHKAYVDDGPAAARAHARPGGVLADFKWAFPADAADLRF